jgi:hypothetical protein
MRRAIIPCVLALSVAGCVGHASSIPPPISPTDTATLLARPLKLPTAQSGSACPVSPVASRKVGVTDPRGRGPFYLGGPMPQGNFPWNKTVWMLVDGAHGPVFVPRRPSGRSWQVDIQRQSRRSLGLGRHPVIRRRGERDLL